MRNHQEIPGVENEAFETDNESLQRFMKMASEDGLDNLSEEMRELFDRIIEQSR